MNGSVLNNVRYPNFQNDIRVQGGHIQQITVNDLSVRRQLTNKDTSICRPAHLLCDVHFARGKNQGTTS